MLDYEKVRRVREKLGISQQQAAKAAGMKSRQQWNALECGRRASISLATLDKIAAALGVKAKDLLK